MFYDAIGTVASKTFSSDITVSGIITANKVIWAVYA